VKEDTRPINIGIPDLLIMKWPIPALASITHRIAGGVLFVGIAFALYAFDVSLSSEAGFEQIKSMMSTLGVTPPNIDSWEFGFATNTLVPRKK